MTDNDWSKLPFAWEDRPYDDAFRSRLLHQGLSADEMSQFVEAVEADRSRLLSYIHTLTRRNDVLDAAEDLGRARLAAARELKTRRESATPEASPASAPPAVARVEGTRND